jgi:decaprenylphospho-beta-D-erythro-pentofuranosid-2-ulose 2-reductase
MKILIIGATSAIAEATARLWAAAGHQFYLVARDEGRLQTISSDLKIRGACKIDSHPLDVNELNQHEIIIDKAFDTLKIIDVVLIAHGTLGNQKSCEEDFEVALQELHTNAISTLSLLTYIANHMERQKQGAIAVISSVAGDRGRQSNYIYGTAKGAVSIFLQGLRQRLYKSGVHVMTIKPGFVDTPMTSAFKKGLLWAKPGIIAQCIDNGIRRKRNVIYTPWYWWIIMAIIKMIPEFIMKKIVL